MDVGNAPVLVITGGTIFNGGAYGCTDPSTGILLKIIYWFFFHYICLACNGITVNSGTFILNAVEVRNNLGKGIWVPNGNVNEYIINSCRVFTNGVGFDLVSLSFPYLDHTLTICSNREELITLPVIISVQEIALRTALEELV